MSINIGVAAHIAAASPGGPRFEPTMTSEQRRAIENGIWLCQTCSKLIDSDVVRYSVATLREWKRAAEDAARKSLESPAVRNGVEAPTSDSVKELVLLLDHRADRLVQEVQKVIADRDKRLKNLRHWHQKSSRLLASLRSLQSLHEQNKQALLNGQFVAAHQFTNEIHKLILDFVVEDVLNRSYYNPIAYYKGDTHGSFRRAKEYATLCIPGEYGASLPESIHAGLPDELVAIVDAVRKDLHSLTRAEADYGL